MATMEAKTRSDSWVSGTLRSLYDVNSASYLCANHSAKHKCCKLYGFHACFGFKIAQKKHILIRDWCPFVLLTMQCVSTWPVVTFLLFWLRFISKPLCCSTEPKEQKLSHCPNTDGLHCIFSRGQPSLCVRQVRQKISKFQLLNVCS